MKRFAGAFLNFLFNDVITHIPIHGLRLLFLRLFNSKIHKTARVLMHAKILGFWNVTIGERSVINQYTLIDCRRYKVVIGNDTDIGSYTRIWSLQHDPHSEEHALVGGDVIIGDHVWITTSVTILPDISIGRGAVVGSGSVVTRSVNEKAIVAGIPAKVIGQRENSLSYKLNYTPFFD